MDVSLPAAFPVLHPVSDVALYRSLETVLSAGAAGVFLIDQGMPAPIVLQHAHAIACAHPTLAVGVNLLALPLRRTLSLVARRHAIRMIWVDEAPVGNLAVEERYVIDRAFYVHAALFGGIAFKYGPSVDDADVPSLIARARGGHPPLVDVVTTSGVKTGAPPTIEKIRLFRASLGPEAPLAIASGMTVDNVESFVEAGADAFLVATGIERSFGVLDPSKTRDFCDRLRAQPRSGRTLSLRDDPR